MSNSTSNSSSTGSVYGRVFLLFIGVLGLFLFFQILGVLLGLNVQAITALAQILGILGGAIIYQKKFASSGTQFFNFRRLGMPLVGLAVVLITSVFLGLMANLLGGLITELAPPLQEQAQSYQEQIQSLLLEGSIYTQLLAALSVVLIAPICEEIFFRGTMLAEQRRGQTAAGAIILNGVLFSAMHMNPVAFVPLAIVGAYFAHITLRSNSLWAAVAGHAALNLVNGVLLLRLADHLDADLVDPEAVSLMEIGVGLAIFVPLTVIGWWISIRILDEHNSAVPEN